MEQVIDNPLPRRALEELGDIPPLPPHLYGVIIAKINRKRAVVRFAFAAAASLLVAASTFTAVHVIKAPAAYSAEVADHLSGVNSYFNGDVYKTNSNSYGYYEEVMYQE